MNAVLEQPKTELTLVQRAAVALGTAEHELRLRELVKQSANILEVKNGAGRDECHTAYMRLKNSRISVEKASKSATEDAKAFSKAVTAEERRLIAITQAEEDRLQALRDAWDEEVEAERQRKIAAERARIEEIQFRIADIKSRPLLTIGKSSTEISAMIGGLVSLRVDESFEEFIEDAKTARFESLDKMAKAETAARAVECEAESQRQQAAREKAEREEEAARLKAERAELDRIAAEQKAAADAEAARAKAERDAAQAELKAAQDKFNAEQAAQRAETARQQAEAQRVIDDAARVQREAEEQRIAAIHAAEDAAFDAEHGGRELSPDEQITYEAEGAARYQKYHGHGRTGKTEIQPASDLPQLAANLGDEVVTILDNDDEYAPPIALNAPANIYLCVGDLERNDEFINCDVSWCDHPQGESDIKYIRADILVPAMKAALPFLDGVDDDSVKARMVISMALIAAGEAA